MKKTIFAVFALSTFFSLSCQKEKTVEPVANGSYIFWTRISNSNPIDVWVDNSGSINGTITQHRTTATSPDCGTVGYATVSMQPGTYIYLIRERGTNPRSWNGKFTVTAGGCGKLELTL